MVIKFLHMKKLSLILLSSFTLIIFSCDKKAPQSETKIDPAQAVAENKEIIGEKEAPKVKSIDFDLAEDIVNNDIEEKLFGKFFDERAEFFIIKEPHKTIHNANVKKMTLFYLDGKLAKMKYILDSDISNALLNNYGSCKLKGLDPEDRYLMKNSEVIKKEDNSYTLSDKLNNFQIQWDLDDRTLVLRVQTKEDEKIFEFEEKILNYERYFKTMEINKISL